jgi:hypothetical protein
MAVTAKILELGMEILYKNKNVYLFGECVLHGSQIM